jgi:glycosyltransferase involved in cell wall biosynthesis
MSTPLFSIITPTCRRPLLLRRNILSVINQTFKDYEHIIIDDANDESTAGLIGEFNDSRIEFRCHSTPKGAAGSYNTGIKASRGQFILFLDDDDEYMPCFLEKMHKSFSYAGLNIGFIWPGISRIKDTESGEIFLFSIVWPSMFSTKEEGLIAATSIGNGFGVCVRRTCIDVIGLYDESLTVCEDTDFLFRLVQKFDFETIPEVLVKIHQHGNAQLTGEQNFLERIDGKEKILTRYNNFLIQYPRLYLTHYKAYADLCYKKNFKKRGRQRIFSLIKRRPLRLLNYADLISYELTGKDTANTYLGKRVRKILCSVKSKKT